MYSRHIKPWSWPSSQKTCVEDRTEHGKANRHHLVMVLMLLLLLGGALVVRTGAQAAAAQERIATVTWEGVGRRREREE